MPPPAGIGPTARPASGALAADRRPGVAPVTLPPMAPPRVRAVAPALALGLALALALAACGAPGPAVSTDDGGPAARTADVSAGATSGAGAAATFDPGMLLAIPGAPSRPTGPTSDATLVRVVDGDTIRVLVDGVEERVRYIGMDTPELEMGTGATPEPYAEAATDANRRLLAGGRLVVERDVSERDRYGRLLRDVWIERNGSWTLVNLALVAAGYAQVATYPPDVKYAAALRAAQRAARDAGRGLWGLAP